MNASFKEIKNLLGERLIQIDCFNELGETTFKSSDSPVSLIKALEPKAVLYVKKTILEKICEFAPKVIDADLKISNYLNFLQIKVNEEAKLLPNGSKEQNRYFDFYEFIGTLINARHDEICEYQLFFPLNGFFLTNGLIQEDWFKYRDFFTDFQDLFISKVQSK